MPTKDLYTRLTDESVRKAVHPAMPRRTLLQAGGVGLLGLGMHHLDALRALAAPAGAGREPPRAKSVVFVFLSGGAAQHDTFDPKPEAPDSIRGEFRPIATQTPGIDISEHLPLLAQRSHLWALCRPLTHKSDDHDAGHQIMLSGRSELPAGFLGFQSQATIYEALGIPRASTWHDTLDRPHQFYHGQPIAGLF